jgi:hypothetical protein
MNTVLQFSSLVALLAVSTPAQNWTVQDFGRQCGGDLAANVQANRRGVDLRFAITGAAPDAVAILVIGHRAPSPVALPGSHCELLVDARHTLFTTTDARGQAGFTLALPNIAPVAIDFQAVVATFGRTGRMVGSTDGVRVSSR